MKKPASFKNGLTISPSALRRQVGVPFQSGGANCAGTLKSAWAVLLLLCLATLPSSAQEYTVLHSFGATALGSHPYGGLVQGPDGTLYGTTTAGGAFNYGTVFKINADGSGYTVLHSFNGGDGSGPQAALVLSGTTLYGTTRLTSNYFGGTLFKLSIDGSNFTVLRQYNNGTGGAVPTGGLVLSGTTLYGTTEYTQVFGGGASGYGTVFKVNTDGSGYVVLRTLSLTDGNGPSATLLLDGATLYGTTWGGGAFWPPYNCGTVFKVNTDGSGFALLRSFTVTDGDYAFGSLTLSGGTLYGTTYMGGDVPQGVIVGNGTVFKINIDGSGFALLKTFFHTNEGANLQSGLLLVGRSLFGTTPYTSTDLYDPSIAEGYGTIFGVNTDGTGFTVLKTFSGTDGANPHGNLLLAGGKLYGTASQGGLSNNGVVFALTLPPPTIDRSPASQTAELGSNVRFSVLAHNSLTYQWYFNETNFLCTTTDGVLQLNHVQASDAGAYRVVATNITGAVTSSAAMLSVIAPIPRRIVPALTLLGQTGTLLNLDSSTAPGRSATWETFDTVSLTSPSQQYFDLTTPLPPQQFYRAWQTNALSSSPRLDLHQVPAITLTGNVGDTLRLDYINQIGPTDAWVTLATVTLTNTSQLYFDTSSIGQPARLWRIAPVP